VAPLPGTPSPQPHPTCQDGILKGGPRDRVWTTGPYPSCKLVAPDRGHPQAKKEGESPGNRAVCRVSHTDFFGGPTFFLNFVLAEGGGHGRSGLACTARRSQANGALSVRFTFRWFRCFLGGAGVIFFLASLASLASKATPNFYLATQFDPQKGGPRDRLSWQRG